jgi:hypothetical protein
MRIGVVLVACVVLTGCIGSVHPLYYPGEKTFDKKLLGDWYFTEVDEDEWKPIRVTKTTIAGEPGYRVMPIEPEDLKEAEPLLARLARIDRINYLDVQEVQNGVPGPHLFARPKEAPGGYDIYVLDKDRVKDYLKEHPDAVKHTVDGDTVELTAKPHGLRRFIRSLGGNSEAWTVGFYMRRTSPPPKP